MPPVAQFKLPTPGQQNSPQQSAAPQSAPPVAQFSLPNSSGSSPAPQTLGQQAVGAAGAVGNFLFPVAGDIKNVLSGTNTKTPLQIVGDTALSALPFVPGLGEVGEGLRGADAALEGANAASKTGLLGKALASPLVKNAGIGYGAGVASNLSQGKSIGQSISPNLNNVGGAVVGGVAGKLLGGLGGGSGALSDSAAQDITKVLAPTTKADKLATQEIAPQLAQKGIVSPTREGLLSKYQNQLGVVGEKLEGAYEQLPEDAKFEVTNLFDTLQKKVDGLMVNGTVPSAAQSKVNALQNMMKDLANTGISTSEDGSQVFSDVANVRKLRQILDSGKKNFSFTDLDTANNMAQKQLANSIREEFGNQFPDIAKLNKDYNFWSKATDVLSNTITRKTGQSGLLSKARAEGAGAVAGQVLSGHPLIGGIVGRIINEVAQSPALHTASALVKSKLAEALSKGDAVGATQIIQNLAKATPAVASEGYQGLLNNFVTPQTK